MKMKVLKGLEELKYRALYNVYMYQRTGDRAYMFTLSRIIVKALRVYGLAGLYEVSVFIYSESE